MKKWLKKFAKEKMVNVFREYEADLLKMEGDPKKLEEDKKKFDAADVNKDGSLTKEEHVAFLYHPSAKTHSFQNYFIPAFINNFFWCYTKSK